MKTARTLHVPLLIAFSATMWGAHAQSVPVVDTEAPVVSLRAHSGIRPENVSPAADAFSSDNATGDEPAVSLHSHTTHRYHKRATQPATVTEVAPTPAPVPHPRAKTAAHQVKKPVVKVAATAQPFMKDYEEPRKDAPEMPLGRVILDLVVKLAVVLGVAYGAIYILRALMGQKGITPSRKGHLKVLETASLGPNRSVHLVRAGGKVLVIGATADSISTIGEIEDPDVLAELQEDGGRPFAFHLDAAGDGRAPLSNPAQDGARHLWERVQEIRGLRGSKGGSK